MAASHEEPTAGKHGAFSSERVAGLCGDHHEDHDEVKRRRKRGEEDKTKRRKRREEGNTASVGSEGADREAWTLGTWDEGAEGAWKQDKFPLEMFRSPQDKV